MNLMILTALMLVTTAPDDFREKVAPILQARCVSCHGETARKGGLALHSAESVREGGESGPAVEPRKPDESLLIEKIVGDVPEMPKGSPPLSAEEVATLKRWIAGGAEWPDGFTIKTATVEKPPLWSLQPLTKPELPADDPWARNPIDRFVLAEMRAKGLSPSPEADRRVLIRRLTFDLHGLPPSPAEIHAFVDEKHPDAYERLVDRLLASPRYGERWGRHWLDVAHYGDTHGYDKDKPRRNAWRYRDWVINALNVDMPYAQFVREQVAGDVLDPGNPDATIATGFLAAGPWDFVGHAELREGTVDKEKTRLIDRDDMLANVMSSFASMTVHCARCHDHKFDPIPQKDYYRLQAVFAGVERADRPVESLARAQTRTDLASRTAAALARRDDLDARICAITTPEIQAIDETIAALQAAMDRLPHPTRDPSPSNGYHSLIHDAIDKPAWVQVDLGEPVAIDQIRLIPARPVDFADTPGFGFPPRFQVELSDDPTFATSEVVFEANRLEGQSWLDEPVVIQVTGKRSRYVRMRAHRLWKRSEDFVFAIAEMEVVANARNVAIGRPVHALDSIEGGLWRASALVDGFSSRERRPAPDDPTEASRDTLRDQIRAASEVRETLADAAVPRVLRDAIASTTAELAKLDQETLALPPVEMVYGPVPRVPRPIHLLRRGDVEQPADLVEAGALACVPGLNADFAGRADEGARRAALASWLTDRENMLTWRSIVNRVWHHHFGRGIVDTPNDFGRNGSVPSHPKLLDWLAVEFRDGGGSLKSLHRLIATSQTYRQVSAENPAQREIDADNRFLWRQNRRRIEAEAVRDAVLMVSGDLDLAMGGPGFEPFRFKDDHSPIYDHEDVERLNAPECRRRAVYRFAVRSVPNPFVECLDGADPNAMTPVRNATITALQALTLLNDPFMIRQSESFAKRLAASGPDRRAQIQLACEQAFGRVPREDETTAILAYAQRHGLAKACRILFNANEFMFVD